MRKSLSVLALAAVMVAVGLLGSPRESDAAFHLMRVYGVMGGAFGDPNIQYVQLRMTNPGQNFVQGHDICFYDATGAPYARFRFPSNVANGTGTPSILIGTAEFDAAWAAGSPDFTFSGANTTQIAPLADVSHPVRAPAGKVAFGSDTATMPAAMCQSGFTPSLLDSVAYGTGYTGTVDLGTKFNTDLPVSGTSAVRLTGTLCHPQAGGPCPRNNSTDYSLLDVTLSGNHPQNNANQSGPLSFSDADGDGVADGGDLCPGTAPAAPVDSSGCSQAQVDQDGDGVCTPGAPSGGPGGCTGSDNCPDWENANQLLPAWTMPAGDTDCDGYHATNTFAPRASESTIQTVATKHCMNTATAFDEPLPDAWPPDFNDNQLVNVADVLSFNNVFGQPITNPPVNFSGTLTPVRRWDLNGSSLVNVADVLQLNPFMFLNCRPIT
jgi:hypothetical protein